MAKNHELGEVADWLFGVCVAQDVCDGVRGHSDAADAEMVGAGGVKEYVLFCEAHGRRVEASLLSLFYGVGTTATLNAREQAFVDYVYAVSPRCACGSKVPELADVVEAGRVFCHPCAGR